MHPYSDRFYREHRVACARSAMRVAPLLLSLFRPRSVIDVGCGDGAWLAEFARLGVDDVLGVDGPYVSRASLQIGADRFMVHDLNQPLDLQRTFDLVLSLEVAEHLSPRAARPFVESLTRHGNLIVFSAAVPGQFGLHHLNEQWPPYWVDLFREQGFALFDIVRWRIWDDPEVSWWYRQNILVFATPARVKAVPSLVTPAISGQTFPIAVAHPEFVSLFRDTLRTYSSARLLSRKLLGLLATRLSALAFWPLLRTITKSSAPNGDRSW